MGDFSGKMDVEKLILYSDDLVEFLKDKRDILSLTQCLEHSETLRSFCDADFSKVQSSIQDYEKKIDACRHKTDAAKSESASDAEIDIFQKELEEEVEKERLLMEELRVITSELNDLECQRTSVHERKLTLKKLEQDELRAQRKLSMYASVTNIIPDLDDQTKTSGHIVDRDKQVIQKFEFGATKMSDFDTCNTIWKMINS